MNYIFQKLSLLVHVKSNTNFYITKQIPKIILKQLFIKTIATSVELIFNFPPYK